MSVPEIPGEQSESVEKVTGGTTKSSSRKKVVLKESRAFAGNHLETLSGDGGVLR